jgi:hypothetical protein
MQKETRRRSAVFVFYLLYIYIYTHTHTHTQTHLVTFPNHNHQIPLILFPLAPLYIAWPIGKKPRLQGVLSFLPFVRTGCILFRWYGGVVADPWVTWAIASFIALASLYPTVYIHHRSLSSKVSTTRLKGCFNYCL